MKAVIDGLHARILAAEPEQALMQAQVYGALLWGIDLGIYEAVDIEQALVARCTPHVEIVQMGVAQEDCLHVVSEPYLQGGHTRLMERLSSMHASKPDLLVTRQMRSEVQERLAPMFQRIAVAQGSKMLERLQSILQVMARYRKVVLHLHPDDILAIVACGLLKQAHPDQVTIFFVNHADHAFNFSASVADYYFEISAYGRQIDEKRRLKARKSFLGIPIDGSHHQISKPLSEGGRLKVFTAASAFKYKPHAGLDIRPSVRAVLSHYRAATFWVIGANPLTNIWWWPLKLRYPARFFMRRHLPYADYLALVEQADFYMDSYPLPGGTAFAEQLLRGQRCIGLAGPMPGYSPAEQLKVDTVAQMLASIEHSDAQQYEAVAAEVLKVNGVPAVRQRYLDCIERGHCAANPLAAGNAPRGDLEFLRVQGKVRSMISVEVFSELYRTDTGLAWKLLRSYAGWPGMKLLVKFVLARRWARRR